MRAADCRHIRFLIPFLLVAITPLAVAQTILEIPFELRNGLIVVKASYGKNDNLHFMIDTGATCSAVDPQMIRRFRLKTEDVASEVKTLNNSSMSRKYYLPGLRVGPVFTTVHCVKADLFHWRVDGILGLDVLCGHCWLASCDTKERVSGKSITIDFDARMIRFGKSENLEHTAPLETIDSQLVVRVRMFDDLFRMALDSGTNMSVLYQGTRADQMNLLGLRPVEMHTLGDMDLQAVHSRQKEVMLPALKLGTDQWTFLRGSILKNDHSCLDGVLSVSQLRFKILHLDFEHNLMSWQR